MRHICYYFGCNYYIRTKGHYFYIKVIQSALMCHCKERKIYSPANIYNSDELVMSRGNRKNFTYAFCKSGALHFTTLRKI